MMCRRCGSVCRLRYRLRENPVNQSGSVALSAEEVRGPPQRNLLIISAFWTQPYEPGGRGFKSCRARYSAAGTFARYTIPIRVRVGWYFGTDRFESEGESLRVSIDHGVYR